MTNENCRNNRIFAESKDDEIFISGISGIFPKARNVHELEHKLYNKVGTLRGFKVLNTAFIYCVAG